ncbi:MAG: amidohydrolase family protein [Holophagaceae bacterium]|uniref:Amidohydrolase family protein n=1 Tax=Candidatus Geothrix skivensis TaxID=2954439 RepID=A0A9D7SGI0_9BACT|nr:amidohydrolase family protein [Candidatus Geothrix skivensis]
MKTLIRNGRVALDGRIQSLDVLVEGERIAAVGAIEAASADRVIEAAGCYVLPGFIDFHTHVDDQIGPFYLADTYESATRVGLENGVTTLCTFVTQETGETLLTAMARARAKAEGRSHSDVLWHLTPTTFSPADIGSLRTLVHAGYHTLKLYTTYKKAGIYASYDRIEALFQSLGHLGTQFLIHCEDDELIEAVDASGLDLSKPISHARLRPEAAEVVAIERVAGLAIAHQAAMHVVHVSTLEGARHLVANRGRGDLSFETCPQYLFLDESWLARADGHRWLCSPPLRSDRAPFLELIRQGAADIIATDHCPFCSRDKDSWDGQDLRAVPNGMPGLGSLPHVTWKIWEDDPDRAALGLSTHVSLNPARRAGLGDRKGSLKPGLDADVVVLDPRGPERPLHSTLSTTHEAFPGFTTSLSLRHVLLRGETRVRDGQLTQPGTPTGRLLQPAPSIPPLT